MRRKHRHDESRRHRDPRAGAGRRRPEIDVALGMPSFDGVVKAIKEISSEFTRALEELRPDKASLEFGVDIGIEAGQLTALLVKGAREARR